MKRNFHRYLILIVRILLGCIFKWNENIIYAYQPSVNERKNTTKKYEIKLYGKPGKNELICVPKKYTNSGLRFIEIDMQIFIYEAIANKRIQQICEIQTSEWNQTLPHP